MLVHATSGSFAPSPTVHLNFAMPGSYRYHCKLLHTTMLSF